MSASTPIRALVGLLLAIFLLFLLLSVPALAFIDLVAPADNLITNVQNISFEYYPSVDNLQSCTLSVDAQTFPGTNVTNGVFNAIAVANISEGSHVWRISCSNGTGSEFSVIRILNVDRTVPSLVILSPNQGATVNASNLTFRVSDDRTEDLPCDIAVDGLHTSSVTLQNGSQRTVPLGLTQAGSHNATVACTDEAGNQATATRSFTYVIPPPPLFLNLTLDKQNYSLGEQVLLTIDTVQDANVSLEVCPDQQGFVQCYTPLIGAAFPQTAILPYTNRTGRYVIDGVALRGNESVHAVTGYAVDNTMRVSVAPYDTPQLGDPVTYHATAMGAIGAVTYNWTLSNGSTADGQEVTVNYTDIGTFTERVTATDAAGNNATAVYVATIDPTFDVTVHVTDAATGAALANATVQVQSANRDSMIITTRTDGTALIPLESGTYKFFVSIPGYAYVLQEATIESSQTIEVKLEPQDNVKPVVTILSPDDGASVTVPVSVRFTVADQGPVDCAIYYDKSDGWLQQGDTLRVTDGSEQSFSLDALQESAYNYSIECVDTSDNRGESATRSFTVLQAGGVGNASGTADFQQSFGDDPLAVTDQAYAAYDGFDAGTKALADLLGWEDLVAQAKKTIERAQRDIESLDFRRDLTDDEKAQKRTDLEASIADAKDSLPVGLTVEESQTNVAYLKEEDLTAIAPEVLGLKGYAFTEKQLIAYLKALQQRFTDETRLVRATLTLADGTTQPISVVSHSFRYSLGATGGGNATASASAGGTDLGFESDVTKGTYTIYESIPDDVAAKASDVVTENENKVLRDAPPVLEFGPEQRITYYVKGDVPLERLAAARTLLLKRPSASDMDAVTGNATFSVMGVDWRLSLLLTLALVALVFILRRIDLVRHLRYLLYAESRKQPLHGLETIISDGFVHAEAGDLERAMMRYKEAKLVYERLPVLAQNEAYKDLLRLKGALDSAYFSKLTHRIHDAIDDGRFEDAVDDFARLEGTYDLLAPEEQEQLIIIVNELASQLGLTKEEVKSSASGTGGAS